MVLNYRCEEMGVLLNYMYMYITSRMLRHCGVSVSEPHLLYPVDVELSCIIMLYTSSGGLALCTALVKISSGYGSYSVESMCYCNELWKCMDILK